jgi:hypothetical protein
VINAFGTATFSYVVGIGRCAAEAASHAACHKLCGGPVTMQTAHHDAAYYL